MHLRGGAALAPLRQGGIHLRLISARRDTVARDPDCAFAEGSRPRGAGRYRQIRERVRKAPRRDRRESEGTDLGPTANQRRDTQVVRELSLALSRPNYRGSQEHRFWRSESG